VGTVDAKEVEKIEKGSGKKDTRNLRIIIMKPLTKL